jgi:Resolvase, N terminal domain.
MGPSATTIKYILYARKSSSSEDRQIQSIDDQVARLSEMARMRGLCIVSTMHEAMSAKVPEQRPVFAQMVAAIDRGDADGISLLAVESAVSQPDR